MKKLVYLTLIVLFAFILSSCAKATSLPVEPTSQRVEEMINPGDKIGDITLAKDNSFSYPMIWDFCEFDWETNTKPHTSTTDCNIPLLSNLAVGPTWYAEKSKFASNWEAISWELNIDGYQVALEDFGWDEIDASGGTWRMWDVVLQELSYGTHIIRISWSFDTAIDDGFNIYQPGKYNFITNVTFTEKATYPAPSSTAISGQHNYTLQKAQLNFLLYLPGEYGKDPQSKWPLIIYLHSANMRGAGLDLLRDEPLPRKLETQRDFPFIVVSPQGDGGYEFWSKDDMIESLFILLDELQSIYSVDPKRIYLTGVDMGGNGVWEIGLRRPDYFAALAPVGGYIGHPFEVPKNICALKDVPVLAFHGGKDTMVPASVEQELVDALVACGGDAKLTINPNYGHDIEIPAYGEPGLYDWLLAQSK